MKLLRRLPFWPSVLLLGAFVVLMGVEIRNSVLEADDRDTLVGTIRGLTTDQVGDAELAPIGGRTLDARRLLLSELVPILGTLSVTRTNRPTSILRWESELLVGSDTLELTLVALCQEGQERIVLEAIGPTASRTTRVLLTSRELESWMFARIGPKAFSCERKGGADS